MELKKVLNELKMVNDINELSLEELKQEYLKDEETYTKFSNDYYEFFVGNPMYQIRVSNNYEKIANLYLLGVSKYNNEENIDTYLNLLDIMAYDKKEYQLGDMYKSDIYEAETLFCHNFGNALPKNLNYNGILQSIEVGAKQYDVAANNSKEFFRNINYRINCLAEEKYDITRIIDDYSSSDKGMILCNNINFLLFANYMVSYHNDMIDENFKKEVEKIIKTSQLLQCAGYDDFNIVEKDDYNKLAKFTLKHMKKEEKKEEKEDKKALRKVKQFFTQNSNK